MSSLYTSIAQANYKQKKLLPLRYIFGSCRMFWRVSNYIIGVYRREFIYTKHIVFNGSYSKNYGAYILVDLSLAAWLCEKMKVNLKIEGLSDFFSDDVIINNVSEYQEGPF